MSPLDICTQHLCHAVRQGARDTGRCHAARAEAHPDGAYDVGVTHARGSWARPLKALSLAAVLALTPAIAAVQSGRGQSALGWGQTEAAYDGRFTFVRLRWDSGLRSGGFRRGGMNDAWNHDFPRAEQNLLTLLNYLTLIDAREDGSLVLRLTDPDLFKFPIVYMWEPGFWQLSDLEAARFREYLLKGGFAIFDDFEQEQWDNFEQQMRRILPEARFVKLDRSHRVFDSFFRMTNIDFPHPMMGILPTYYGIFEDNDPSRRLMVIANYNNDVAEYWEWSGSGLFPVDTSNEAYKLGVNYMLYGLTH